MLEAPGQSPPDCATPRGSQRRSSSRCALRALHIDPRRGTGVDWRLSEAQPAQRTGPPTPQQNLETVKNHLKPNWATNWATISWH